MKFSTRLRWAVAGVFLVVVVRATVTGRNRSEDAAPPVPESGQQIVLQGAHGEVPFAVERLNVYLTEDDQYPESFEFEGKDISLVGLIPTALHVGYDEDWSVLVGHPIAFSRNIDDNSADSGSHIRIPGESLTPVVGGEFTIQEVGEGSDAKTPLIGEIRLKCMTPAGEREYRGTFKVKGTTWG
jgi:hypothetical protein